MDCQGGFIYVGWKKEWSENGQRRDLWDGDPGDDGDSSARAQRAFAGGPGAAGKGGQAEQRDAGKDKRPAGRCEEGHHGLCGGDPAGGGSRLPVSVWAGSEGLRGSAEEAGCTLEYRYEVSWVLLQIFRTLYIMRNSL